MTRAIRREDKDQVFFVTARCFQQRFYFRPSKKINSILLGCLAWAAKKHKVHIHAFVFMSNHFHLLITAPEMNLSRFMCEFQSRVACELNKHLGRKGKFFEKRFKPIPVIDDEAIVEKLRYTLCNPVESLLVPHIDKWPGLSSWDAEMGDREVEGRFILMKDYREKLKKNPDLTREEAKETYRKKVRELVDKTSEHACDAVEATPGGRFVGAGAVKAQHWDSQPEFNSSSPAPLCLASSHEARKNFRKEYKQMVACYRSARRTFCNRNSDKKPKFPCGTYPPGGLLYCVRA